MIRTKDFVVILIACMLATIGAGFFFVSSETPPVVLYPLEGVFFFEARDRYSIIPYVENSLSENRDAFIDKIRQAYIPKVEEEKTPAVTPTAEVSPIQVPLPPPYVEETPIIIGPTPSSTTSGTGTPYTDPSM